jgi:hypothetical protein
MTSSTRPIIGSGTVRASAFAVLRLMIRKVARLFSLKDASRSV